ncbi:MAG: hypothetical protein ACREK1_03720 [Longimicrobiales bacterium]
MPTAKLLVKNLRTAEDATRLQQTVRRVAGVYGVVASCRERCMEVDFEDDVAAIGEIIDAASAAGFDATLAG